MEYANQRSIGIKTPMQFHLVDHLIMPSNEDAIKFVRSHLATHVLVIYAVARVSYNGRAKANLNANPYLIIIKPDGTFMVHGSRREKPLIWNPPGSRTYIEARDGLVVLLSIRASPGRESDS